MKSTEMKPVFSKSYNLAINCKKQWQQVGESWFVFSFKIPEQNDKLTDIIENEPLTADQIKQLSSLGDRYIVPFSQTNSKTYTIILHNTYNRSGGETEADVMEQAMRDTGSEVIKIEWWAKK